MKTLRAFAATCVLALVLVTAVRADDGYIHTGISAPPPPAMADEDGYIHTDFASTDPVIETALTLIRIVLTLP